MCHLMHACVRSHSNTNLAVFYAILQAQLGQILLQLTREFAMTALDYVKAVQAAEQAAGPTAMPEALTPVKQVRV